MLGRFPISGDNSRTVRLWLRVVMVPAVMASAVIAPAVIALVIMALASPPVFADTDSNEPLPELGDSAARVLSPAQEEQIGRQFLRQLIRDRAYVDDPELNAYLNQLGARIAQSDSLRGTTITVHLIENPDLNAFAVPGGHITLHTGLILTTEDESELASVVGHEIAHISQRHLPRLMAKEQASQLPAVAAILASVLIGGQTGLAGFTLANAALLSNQLAYTRDFEREADSIGIKLLAEADFDPAAMGRFFNTLDRHGGLGDEGPEFLRSHPLSYTRIAEAENRAGAYPPRDYPVGRAFLFAQAKIRATRSPRSQGVIDYFKDRAEKSSGDKKDAAIYGIALAQLKLRQYDQARATLQPLLEAHPHEVALHIARAEIDLAAGDPAAAAARYEQLLKANPQSAYLIHYLAEAMIANGDAAGAKRAIRHQLRRHKEMFTLYPLLAKSNAKLGLLAEAHQATAEFHAALGEYGAAVFSLKLALRENHSEEGYLKQSVIARMSELQEMLK